MSDQTFVEDILQNIFVDIGIEQPQNFDDIVQFVLDDVLETCGDNYTSEDVRIGFRRFIEKK